MSVEKALIEPVKDRILRFDEFIDYSKKMGFETWRRGTSKRNEGDAYIYSKNSHEVPDESMVKKYLAAVRYLTEKGILYPETQWGIYFKPENNTYQLFAITRKLNQSGEKYDSLPNLSSGSPSAKDWEHITKWYQRINPDFNGCENPGNNDITELLNYCEAMHKSNWAVSDEGKAYPIDVEVIDLKNKDAVVNQWWSNIK
ncbi:MAG: hypothetical protein ACP5N3_04385 [Candidatus Nanoarchaeia archaeon]